MRRLGYAATILCCSLFGCRTIETRLETATTPQECLQAAADYYVKDAHDAACAAILITPNETRFAFAGDCSTNSLFRIASLSKIFLDDALNTAVAQGAINPRTTLGDYLPLPSEYAPITLDELRNNRSGLPRDFINTFNPIDAAYAFAGGFWGANIYGRFNTRADFFAKCEESYWRRIVRKNRAKVPREVVYSNIGYGLLGVCLEKATNQSLEQFLDTYLIKPLGLTATTYDPEAKVPRPQNLTPPTAGHLPWFTRRGNPVPDIRLGEPLRAAGGLFSSPADCARVFRDYWRIVDLEYAKVPRQNLDDYKLIGLLRLKMLSAGSPLLYRAGMIYGGASFVCYDFETRTVIVILRNVTSWPDRRGFKLVEALRHIECAK